MLLPASQQSSRPRGAMGIILPHGTPSRSHPDPVGVGAAAANIKCSGHVWIEPAPVVRMGSNISINCLSTLGCNWDELSIFLNDNRVEGPLRPLNSTTFQLQLQDFRMPLGTVLCLAKCSGIRKLELVCGTDILAGCESSIPLGFPWLFLSHQHRGGGGRGESQHPGLCIAWRRGLSACSACPCPRRPSGPPQQPDLLHRRALGAPGMHVGRGAAHPPQHPLHPPPAQVSPRGTGGAAGRCTEPDGGWGGAQ